MSTYVVSDLHGHLTLYNKINKFIKPTDTVYCLGDCGDRGPQPWETIKAVASDPRFVYLMGNHEDMLLGAMQHYYDERVTTHYNYSPNATSLLYYNGGAGTLDGWIEDGAKHEWIDYLKNLPLRIDIVNENGVMCVLTHAGPTSAILNKASAKDLLWDRNSNAKWPDEFDNILMIHGHTPIPYMDSHWKLSNGSLYYSKGHKVNIDGGAAMNQGCILFDLDTYEDHVFTCDEEDD